jgi:hypothetical protein
MKFVDVGEAQAGLSSVEPRELACANTAFSPSIGVMRYPPRRPREPVDLSAYQLRWLCAELCSRLGVCDPDLEAIAAALPADADALADMLLVMEGFGPGAAPRQLHRQVRALIDDAIARPPKR